MKYVDRFDSAIEFWATSYGLDPKLIKKQMIHLSKADPAKVDGQRVGLMQIHVASAKAVGINPEDSDSSIKAACIVMEDKIRQVRQTLGSYKATDAQIYRMALGAYEFGFGPVRAVIQLLRDRNLEPTWTNISRRLTTVDPPITWKEKREIDSLVDAVLPEEESHGRDPGVSESKHGGAGVLDRASSQICSGS